MKAARILLAAGASGSGKTLITCGLLQALVNRGLKTASFKCGPDYIDPMFHSRVIGAKSRNLDTFFTDSETTKYLFCENAADCDISVMEGVMGFYDGVAGTTTKASAYDLASVTDTPVILIVNSRGMSVSLAAYVKGFMEYRKDSHIQGVIFNQMSPMLYPRMKELLEKELNIKVLGYVPKMDDCVIESRHLGLVLPDEIPELKENLHRLAEVLEKTLDIDAILQLYEDNFRLLRKMGAELVHFSPIRDKKLPAGLDGLLLYGGYPELNGKELEKNTSMREEIQKALSGGMPCMAECGGFMYLHEEMEAMDKKFYHMAGVLPGRAYRTPRLNRFGYVTLIQNHSVLGCETLGEIPAHEFHYFDSENCGKAFHAAKPESVRNWECIHGTETMLAGFPHLYYYGNPKVAEAFLKECMKYHSRRGE